VERRNQKTGIGDFEMILYSPCWWDEWLDRMVHLTYVEAWFYPATYFHYRNNGKHWWTSMGDPGWMLYDDENNRYVLRHNCRSAYAEKYVNPFVFQIHT
jgi:hypothetical protein